MNSPSPSLWSDICKKKYLNPEELHDRVAALKKSGKTIVTLNGSFDLLHAGHLQIIFQASLMGDILIVGLNSDQSIKNYKSPNRPIIPLKYRLQMISALEFVSFVSWFEETDPRNFLEKIRPNIHVNGEEYGENCIEAPVVKAFGGKIEIIPLIPSLSSSEIIKKIKTEG